MRWSSQDHAWMARAIRLARQGLYSTDPNPRVGCVLVQGDELVGEGYHLRAGEGHAEVNALRMAGERARGCTAYVTLEPCSHQGRTPPCADALVRAGVSRVVAAMVDPNPQVAGRGLERLRSVGISADSGLLEAEARSLNPGFIRRMETGRPWVRLKLAMSLDGRTAMASGESQWITGPAARADVQRLRARSSAILTGVDSILLDDSSLTVRPAEAGFSAEEQAAIGERQPLRLVLDSRLRMSPSARILDQPGRTLVVSCQDGTQAEAAALVVRGAELLCLPGADGRVDLAALLDWLGAQQCNELLVETGATLAGALVAAQLVDEILVYMAPKLLGSAARPLLELPFERMSQQIPLHLDDMRQLGADIRFTLNPQYPQQQPTQEQL
ncbi:bifunctional diaminohydroxyphosphoribosylaminopyrimidine deaminase/5-amino-6-(5-phosphoribosylamino)uracil reductase RibD [Marinobacterium sedimentorum]|uniref:bifunctional diaminohydroxyphosphoribosylaminopyrimidine deaminase/5-amino-6-(5-phosphoribosylamino)uracil reductase RibD n=1 Tax=Marinobacterium sedimentorum TaxID=2927804 RepID=UPI0020C7472E|nr:bifunctional diaminohydroxyphosphoribosylaminopyrimidine deaminase/5-amino-6-(5-phosphoribosylamino)uracil reductase RibD [Marinobacterium sedimentorum]MCP8686118.1 bifunctional diaminohydroxyphosphoribosylaminopyrimidine deaminase/5-amino-6-(5-phosphoribosylamino)uracil reductase RibD [Marinobacterium sedimentorum]